MDAKSRDLALLTALSLSCAGVALISDYLVLASVFFRHGDVFHQGADDSQYDVCPTASVPSRTVPTTSRPLSSGGKPAVCL